jgi:hypothetical protein
VTPKLTVHKVRFAWIGAGVGAATGSSTSSASKSTAISSMSASGLSSATAAWGARSAACQLACLMRATPPYRPFQFITHGHLCTRACDSIRIYSKTVADSTQCHMLFGGVRKDSFLEISTSTKHAPTLPTQKLIEIEQAREHMILLAWVQACPPLTVPHWRR